MVPAAKTALPPRGSDATLAPVSNAPASSGHCVVWGGYGYGNTGDDLLLALALAKLRQSYGNALHVFSPHPEHTRLTVPDPEVIRHPERYHARRWQEKWFWRLTAYAEDCKLRSLADRLYRYALENPQRITTETAWLRSLAGASRLHLAGGGYLAERFDWRHFLRPVRLARSRNLRITTSPLGLGPFPTPKRAAALAAALRGAELVVRDEDSLQFCQAHGLAAVEQPDDGFDWRQVIELPAANPPPATNTIGVCIFSQYSKAWSERAESWWVECLQSLTKALPDHCLEGFCFHTNRQMDYDTTRRLFARAGLSPDNVRPPQADFREAIADLRRYCALLSTRFHAVVSASVLDLPCLAVVLDDYYITKMRGALKHAPAPMSVMNPLTDSAPAAAQWLATRLVVSAKSTSSDGSGVT